MESKVATHTPHPSTSATTVPAIHVQTARGARYVFRRLRESGGKIDEIGSSYHHQKPNAWEGHFSFKTSKKEMKAFGFTTPKEQELFSVGPFDGCYIYRSLEDLLLQSHRTCVSDWRVLAKVFPKHIGIHPETLEPQLIKPLYVIRYKNIRFLREPLVLKWKKGAVTHRTLSENEQAQASALIWLKVNANK